MHYYFMTVSVPITLLKPQPQLLFSGPESNYYCLYCVFNRLLSNAVKWRGSEFHQSFFLFCSVILYFDFAHGQTEFPLQPNSEENCIQKTRI